MTIRVGQTVSFRHEGAGYRIYGKIVRIDGDTLFVVDAGGREYEVCEPLDEVEIEMASQGHR